MRALSASQITTLLACARKYAFRYVENVPPESHSSALAFGSAVHSALDQFHTERLDGTYPDLDAIVRTFRADWAYECEKPIAWKDGETADDLGAMGEALVRLYVERFRDLPIVATEARFEVPLIDRTTGEVMEPTLKGYFDLLVPDHGIVEIKTAARRFDQATLAKKIQLSAYALAYRELRGADPTITVVTLLKHKKPAIDVQTTTRTRDDDVFFVHLAANVARAIDARAFPPNPGWMCGDCEYARACAGWRGDDAPPPSRPVHADMFPVGSFPTPPQPGESP